MLNFPRHLVLFCLLLAATLVGCADNGVLRDKPAAEPAIVGRQLRVLTYNIHHGEGADGKLDLERLAAVIKQQRPDLVALQEVDRRTNRSGGVDQAAKLAELTGIPHYHFAKAMDFDGGEYGEVVLSQHPIIKTRPIRLPAPGGLEPRVANATWIDMVDEIVIFVATHLDHTDDAPRSAQAQAINNALREDTFHAMVLAGDLNAQPGSEPMRVFAELWTDAAGTGAAPTFPSNRPERRIDYILVRPPKRWRTISSRVIDEPVASDHRPVLTVLELRPLAPVDPNESSRRGILWPTQPREQP